MSCFSVHNYTLYWDESQKLLTASKQGRKVPALNPSPNVYYLPRSWLIVNN